MDSVVTSREPRRTATSLLLITALCVLPVSVGRAESRSLDALREGFISPPNAAQPRVWWQWMNGNVSEEGVRRDFEWMKRIGIGGVQHFDVSIEFSSSFDTPQLVAQPFSYLTPDWQRALRYSVGLAREQGLEFSIASSAGWSESGGPWVTPRQAMKKLVWSETLLKGTAPFKGHLASPPGTTGPFQNIPLASLGRQSSETPVYYADVAAIAYRLPASEHGSNGDLRVTSNAGALDASLLSDGDLAKFVSVPLEKEAQAWIQFSYPKPRRIQAVTAVIGYPLGVHTPYKPALSRWLEASDDGKTFRKVADLPRNDSLQQTVSFPPVTARMFRVVLKQPESTLEERLGLVKSVAAYQIAELVLHAEARINRFEDKAGFSTRQIVEQDDTPAMDAAEVLHRSDIMDVTDKMAADGTFEWTPPAGRWMVLRFGYSLTGRRNKPAPRAGAGLEIDKLNAQYVKDYIETYLDHYEDALGQSGIQYVLTDSYEAGPQNWTDDMLEQFERRRGYSAIPWLPALAGRVIDSAAASDRFLWDFRTTLGELMAEAHYGQITASLHKRGMGRYGESHETHRTFIGDGIQAKQTADIPMGAMWAIEQPGYTQEDHDADIRESASVAHIYGQNLVAAESFTAFGAFANTYGFAPEALKPAADRALAMGLNRFSIHTSVHQPDSKVGPGIGLGPYGQWFTRKETWADQAAGWIRYLARSSYLLQQGRFVADVAYLYGEDSNVTSLFGTGGPPVPNGYNFDFVNAEALVHEFSTKDGRLLTRSGMQYRVLALDQSAQRVSLRVLRKIRDLVHAGAVVVGAKPAQTPSLADDESEFRAIVSELWGGAGGMQQIGAGRVLSSQPLAEALQSLQVSADVQFLDPAPDLRFVHRSLGDEGELYFVSNGSASAHSVKASFRVSGRAPELWQADSGVITPLSYQMENGRSIVPLQLEANGAVFVVFRQPTTVRSVVIPEVTTEFLSTVEGPWDLSFPPERGAPDHARFDRLSSWSESADTGIRYFSGTAVYSKNLHIQRDWLARGSRLQIDLGSVKNLAEIRINGRSLGVLWKPPFKVDITDAVKAGDNRLEIRVTNLWPNRLIGDKQPGAQKIAFATFDPFKADTPLLPSGLLGPVTLLRVHSRATFAAPSGLSMQVISSRPDAVSDGNALIALRGVDHSRPTVRLNGNDVTSLFRPSSDSHELLGLVTGLRRGRNTLQLWVEGKRHLSLELINHPRAGPIFSGPHQNPLFCETVANGLGSPLDADCSATTRVEYFYKSTQPVASFADVVKTRVDATINPQPGNLSPGFKPYDPSRPRPADVARTVLTDGSMVDYIVRREVGTINRAVYEIQFLHQPGERMPTPWTYFSKGWNGRVVYDFKGWGCGVHGQGKLGAVATADYEPLLASGYAYVTSTFNATRYNCNERLSAETVSMVKEHFAESFGVPAHTIGIGGSGGSMQLHFIAQNFPGLLDGIVPYISLPDMLSYEVSMSDCALLDHALQSSKLPWAEAQKAAVSGYASWQICATGARLALLDTRKCGRWIPKDRIYDPVSNPHGLRCGYSASVINSFGRDPHTGIARRPIDNVGVQYGLLAFNAGTIDAERFVELNERVGGFDQDGIIVASTRTRADPQALTIAYQHGHLLTGGGGLGQIPIIDWRPYSDDLADIHVRFWSLATRARLVNAYGTASNHIAVIAPRYDYNKIALTYDLSSVFGDALRALVPQMDQWLEDIAADQTAGSALERIARNKPNVLADSCVTVGGDRISEPLTVDASSTCNRLYPLYGDPRIAAGAPIADDVLKCALKPIDRAAYSQPLGDDLLDRLKAVFPDGVCDFTRPGIGQQLTRSTWQ